MKVDFIPDPARYRLLSEIPLISLSYSKDGPLHTFLQKTATWQN